VVIGGGEDEVEDEYDSDVVEAMIFRDNCVMRRQYRNGFFSEGDDERM
jgi:hypothetical protein